MIEIGGQSSRQGIIFKSNSHEIEVKTFPNIEIGDVKRSERSKNDDRRLKIIIPLIILVLLLDEMYHGTDPLRIFVYFIFGMFLFFCLTMTVMYYYHRYGIESFRYIRMNHGAEHKAIEAYINGKIEDIDKTSRFVKMCGGNMVSPIFLIIILGGWIHYPFTICMIYYLCYLYVKPARNILYKIVGIPTQLITTAEPSPEILEAAKIGLLKLVCAEEIYTKLKENNG